MPVASELPVSRGIRRSPSRCREPDNSPPHLAALGAALTVLLYPISPAHGGEWIIDTGARLFFESNINHADGSIGVLDDFAFAPQISAGHYFQLADADGLTLAANARGAVYGQYSGLNSVFGGGSLALKHKFGLGAHAPWMRIHGSAGYSEFESGIRDSGLFLAGFQVGKRFHPRLDSWIGYSFDYRDGPDSRSRGWGKPDDVFTLMGHQISVRSNFLLTDNLNLSFGYGARFGGIYAGRRAESLWRLPWGADAIIRDDAFPGYIAYRINNATTHSFLAEAGYALGGHASLNLRYEYQLSYGAGLSYSNHIPQISCNYTF
jgi:hypothetical protein